MFELFRKTHSRLFETAFQTFSKHEILVTFFENISWAVSAFYGVTFDPLCPGWGGVSLPPIETSDVMMPARIRSVGTSVANPQIPFVWKGQTPYPFEGRIQPQMPQYICDLTLFGTL